MLGVQNFVESQSLFNTPVIEVIYLLPDRYDIFTTDCLWIEVCQNIVLSKIDITGTNKQKMSN